MGMSTNLLSTLRISTFSHVGKKHIGKMTFGKSPFGNLSGHRSYVRGAFILYCEAIEIQIDS